MKTMGSAVSRATGVAILLIGATTLTGWWSGHLVLASWASGHPSQKATAAALLCVLGAALLTRRSIWSRAAAILVCLVSALVLVEWATGASFGIDQLLATDHTSSVFPGRPGRPIAAVTLLVAFCVALDGVRRRSARRAQIVAAGGACAAILAVELGYLFGTNELAGRGMPVPLPTSVSLGVLAVAALALVSDRAPVTWLRNPGAVGRLARRLLPAAILAPPVVGWLCQLGAEHGRYSSDVAMLLFAVITTVMLALTTVAAGLAVARSEADREEISTQLAATFEHLPASMSLRDREGTFLRANRMFADHTSFDTERIVGQPMQAVYPADLLPWAQSEIDQVIASGVPVHSEIETDLGQGPRVFDVTRYPVKGAQGEPIGVGTFTFDVTDRKRAEKAAAEAAERVQALLNSAPDATVLVDARGVIRHANPQIATLLGYAPSDVVGQSIETLVPERVRDHHAALRGSYLKNPEIRPMRGRGLTARHRDGHEVPVEISLGPAATPDGDWTLAAIRDVSEQRAAEDALREAEERYRRDLDSAGAVQRQVLSTAVPDLAGFDAAARFQPASQVSGDFYDWWVGAERLHIVVSDVMGKGAGAAIIGAATRATLHAALDAHEPHRALAVAADVLANDFAHTQRFATCFAADLDPITGSLRWSDAGHGLAVILRASGGHEWLRGRDLPLGVVPGTVWSAHETVLSPGDVLVVASDGLTDDGIADLPMRLHLCRRGNLDQVLDALLSGAHGATDDITLLALRRHA